ncbi:sugar ABC transporter substrate-binding protein [Moorella naiadis]|uniref:sugar ABC transporter substrate-binding protein n=1 Tax=Moorella naiadis (nom. illeg.) TaxID=3093670 RepID=UPI003D9CA4ED
MKKWLTIVAASLVIMLVLTACGQKPAQQGQGNSQGDKKGETVVGYAVMRMVDEYWGNQIEGMKAAIKESGKPIKLDVADNNNDGQTCLQNVESLLGRGAKILIVSTPDPKVGGAIMEKAKAKNVPVIASDVPIEGAYFLNHDDVEAGKIVGDYAGKYFSEKFKGKKAKVALITHAAVEQIVGKRIDGFMEAFKKYVPDAQFLPRMDAEGLREKGLNVMTDILTSNPDVNVVFAINDDMALGAAAAVEARGLADKVAVFGQGGIGETSFRALMDPKSPFIATTAYMPDQHGKTAINKMVIPLLEGQKIPDLVLSPLELATKENASKFLKK